MGGWRASASLLLNHASRRRPRTTLVNNPSFLLIFGPSAAYSSSCTPCRRPPQGICSSFWVRPFSGYPSRVPAYASDNESGCHDSAQNFPMELKEDESDLGKIPVKAYFLSTSIDLKNMQGENLINVVPPTSRSTNYIVLKYYDYQPEITALGIKESLSTRYMVVFQYGSAVLINIEDHEVESYLDLVRRHASGLLPEMRKDDYAIKEKPRLMNDMQGGPDYIVLRSLDTDSIRIIGSVLGQSIALDYFVSQVDGMVEEFAGINRGMEKTGTFTMDRTTLIKLVGKANSNLADVILKVGLFERSEIAWKDAKYAQIYEYLRDEYEVNQRFGSLDFKLKFVEHNIHFLQEVIQNRRSDLLEWCIIFLLTLENAISIYEIVTSS
ncbi:Protein RETARDED ROOT GROWTH, mitochondrial [Linum perenne]